MKSVFAFFLIRRLTNLDEGSEKTLVFVTHPLLDKGVHPNGSVLLVLCEISIEILGEISSYAFIVPQN